MIEQKSGKIINISSLASEYALEDHIAYSVSNKWLKYDDKVYDSRMGTTQYSN